MSLDFSTLLIDSLREAREEDPHEPRKIGVYYASELGNECMRQNYLRYMYPDKPIDNFTLGVFTIGDWMHEKLGEHYKAKLKMRGHKVRTEVNVTPYYDYTSVTGVLNFQIRGRADMIIDKDFVVDFKSVAPNAFRFGDLPYTHHRAQLNFYLNMLGIEKGYIVYVEKYALQVVAKEVVKDYELFKNSIEQTRLLNTCLLYKKPPLRCPQYPDRYPCTYCDFQKECAETGDVRDK